MLVYRDSQRAPALLTYASAHLDGLGAFQEARLHNLARFHQALRPRSIVCAGSACLHAEQQSRIATWVASRLSLELHSCVSAYQDCRRTAHEDWSAAPTDFTWRPDMGWLFE